jgi:hypothetical protein
VGSDNYKRRRMKGKHACACACVGVLTLSSAFTMRTNDFKSPLIINSSFKTLERYSILRRRPAGRWAIGEWQHLLMLTRAESVHPCARQLEAQRELK